MPYLTDPRAKTLGAGAPGASAAGGASGPAPSSGSFTDFGAYVNSTGDQSAQLAQKIVGGADQQAKAAAGLQAPTVTTREGFGNVGSNLQGELAGQSILNGQNQQRAEARKALGPDATSFQNETPGMSRVDSFMANAGGANTGMDALRQKYAGLLGPLQAQRTTVPVASPDIPAAETAPLGETWATPDDEDRRPKNGEW